MQPTETPRIDEYGRLLCHATTREGEPCKSPCVTGMKVCRMHGGSSPQARNRAKLRLAELVDPAIGTLARVMTNQDGNATPSDRLRAANSILDRAGHGWAAQDLGLGAKIHADELAPTGGAQLAAELGAVSADHLLHTDARGIEALAHSETVAVLLPGTSFNLMTGRYAPAQEMLAAGVAIALSTDFNPGSCPTENLQLIMTLGCLKLGLTPAQVLAAVTINAAHAIGLGDRIGSLEAGKQADLVIFDADNEAYLPYHFGINHTWQVIKSGRVVYQKNEEGIN